MARHTEEQPVVAPCHFDPTPILDALDQLAGQIENLRSGLLALDQKVTQMRTTEHQNLLKTVKQVRAALDMATRDNKRQLEFLSAQVVDATKRIQSLDLALSNRKLDELLARASEAKPAPRRKSPQQEEKVRAARTPPA